MSLKTIPQRKFLKGVVATTPKWEQVPGSIPRGSNLLLTDRGGLKLCDGSLITSLLNGALATATGAWTELFLFQPNNVNRYYIGIKKDALLGAPIGLTSLDAGAGGVLGAGTYRYEVTAKDALGNETTVSNETTITIAANHKITLNWTAKPGATSYNIYRTVAGGASGTETLLPDGGGVASNIITNTFTDNGSRTLSGIIIPPLVDTTQLCNLYVIPAVSYTTANIITALPADPFVAVDNTPGGDGGGGGFTGGGGGGTAGIPSGGAPPTPAGATGVLAPIPQIVQFSNKAVLALGNGVAPQLVTDGSPPTSTVITNTFTASYPNWVATTVFAQGTKIMPTAGNAGNFIFTAQQGGTTGGAAPTWPQTPNQIVSDNNIIWQNTGAANTAPAPRGAAHAEVYAGSLWLANTSPTTTTDNFDGPTCLKMSDLNNPTSWNPLNVAFIGKDDGDQITGLKAFTIAADGIAPTGSLIAFKYFKTYQVIGVFGAPDFAIQEVQTDMGCIAPRSIQFLPGFGIVRLTHLGIAIFDSVRDRLISEEIRPYIFGSAEIGSDLQTLDQNFAYLSKGAQSANPPMYMLAIPLALNSLGATAGIVVGASSFTTANYYTRVTKFTVFSNGQIIETAVSTETLTSLNTGRQLGVALTGSADPLAIKYRIYIGTISGIYTQFVDIAPANMPTGSAIGSLTFTSLAQFTGSGTLNVGIGGLTRVLCYDMVLKAWAIIDLPFAISVLKQFRAVGTVPITVTGGFNDGSVRRLQSGDPNWDGTPIQWQMRSAEVFGKLANARIYYRRLTVRGTTTQTALKINAIINLDGSDGGTIPMTVYQLGNTLGTFDFLAQVDIGFTNYTIHVTLSGSNDIEITSLDWEAATLREGVPPVI